MIFQSSVQILCQHTIQETNSYLIVLNGEAAAMINGEINDALHKVKGIINSEVLKDLYKSKASWRNVPALSPPSMKPPLQLGICYNPALIPAHHSSRRMSNSVCSAATLPAFPHHKLESKYLRQNVKARVRMFFGQTLFSMST